MKTDLKRKIAILSIALYLASNSVISGTLIFMQKSLGINITNAEFLITVSSIASVITILLSESITKLIGMKKSVMLGLLLVSISSIIPIIHTSYISILVSRIILGAGIGLFNGHSANYINVFYKGDEAAKLHGIRNSVEFIGQMILLFMAGLLIRINRIYAYLVYGFAFLIMIFFNKEIEDVKLAKDDERFRFNRQILFYIFFAGIMIMNITAVSIRFPSIATIAKGMDVDINLYMTLLPISGMISGFMFGYINRSLRSKTIMLGLFIYVLSNLILSFFGDNMYIYLSSMVMIAFSQSLCTPYLFAEISRFVKGTSNRIANNLIFIGCNIGGFLSPLFLRGFNNLFNSNSLITAFIVFSIVYAFILIIYLYEYIKAYFNKTLY